MGCRQIFSWCSSFEVNGAILTSCRLRICPAVSMLTRTQIIKLYRITNNKEPHIEICGVNIGDFFLPAFQFLDGGNTSKREAPVALGPSMVP